MVVVPMEDSKESEVPASTSTLLTPVQILEEWLADAKSGELLSVEIRGQYAYGMERHQASS